MDYSMFPWHEDAWRGLSALRGRMPHAILFHGSPGIGKTVFAERFAQSLLCEAPRADGHACGECVSCGWFVQYNHPDYRRIRPEVLDEDEAVVTEESGEEKKESKASKAPSKDIKIDQIRALSDFVNVSTHRQGLRVIVLYPAEALNGASANALLKTLEEPPPNTVFLLVSDGLDRLLPTILSRCRKLALPMPTRAQALEWLRAEGIEDAESWLAQEGGAPLAARTAAQAETREMLDVLLGELARPSADGALKTAERLQKASLPDLVVSTQRWLYDVFSVKLSGTARYYPRHAKELAAVAARADTGKLMKAIRLANERRAVAQHPLSARLFVEDMLLDYAALFH
jgi:DNA polymerase-3 subunit delta'